MLRFIRHAGPLALAALILLSLFPSGPLRAAEVGGDPVAFEALAETGFERGTFYRATRPDPRLCPSPLCGGFFVERVNRRRTICADGRWRPECHAALVDFSSLGLDPAAESQLLTEFGSGRVLLRGALVEVDFGGLAVPKLRVDQAWRGLTGTREGRGRWWGVRPSGIACITHPCPVFVRVKLNSMRMRWLHALDLETHSDATPSELDEAQDALAEGPGLIVFGRTRKITGPAGIGRELVASELYTRVGAGRPMVCGGFTFPPNPTCAEGDFCEPPAGTCQIADLPGRCQAIPDACPTIFDPVCGCDGQTYGNDCERRMAQAALDHPGACGTGASCGPVTCGPGTVCCNPLLGICAPPGYACIQ